MASKQPLEIIYLLKTGRTSNLYLYQAALDLAQSKVSMDGILWPLQALGAALTHSHTSRHSLCVLLKFPFLCLVTTDSSFHCTLLRWKRLHHLYKPVLKNGQRLQTHSILRPQVLQPPTIWATQCWTPSRLSPSHGLCVCGISCGALQLELHSCPADGNSSFPVPAGQALSNAAQ